MRSFKILYEQLRGCCYYKYIKILLYLANLEYPFLGNLNFPTSLVYPIYIH